MILDRIENTNLYYGISNRIKIALEYISNTDFSKLETGTYDIVKGEIFAICPLRFFSKYFSQYFQAKKTASLRRI